MAANVNAFGSGRPFAGNGAHGYYVATYEKRDAVLKGRVGLIYR